LPLAIRLAGGHDPEVSQWAGERIAVGIFDIFKSMFGNKAEQEEVAPVEPSLPLPPVERRTRRRLNARPGTRVLIIDDSRTIVAALRKILHSAGFKTMEALDAETGIELLKTRSVEIIFLDIVLPGMNGFSALRLLRKDPDTRLIPVIMMSGNEQATEQFFGSRIGADDFMKMRFSRLEVFSRIERLLDGNLVPRRQLMARAPVPARG
jgi:PleD family two-component response regulator